MPRSFQDKISSFIRLRLFRIRFSRQRPCALWLLAKHLGSARSISTFPPDHNDLNSTCSPVCAL
jgi:hypothetical protein